MYEAHNKDLGTWESFDELELCSPLSRTKKNILISLIRHLSDILDKIFWGWTTFHMHCCYQFLFTLKKKPKFLWMCSLRILIIQFDFQFSLMVFDDIASFITKSSLIDPLKRALGKLFLQIWHNVYDLGKLLKHRYRCFIAKFGWNTLSFVTMQCENKTPNFWRNTKTSWCNGGVWHPKNTG